MAMATTTARSSMRAIGPCFISPGGIGLGPDVGELLQLEGALEGDRVAEVATEEVDVLHLRQPARDRPVARPSARSRSRRDRAGRAVSLASSRALPGRRGSRGAWRGGARRARAGRSGRVALGGGDADLGPGPGCRARRRPHVPCSESTTLVTARVRAPAALGLAQRVEGVDGLARLADRDDERAVAEHGVAVAELARDLDLGRHPRPVLEGDAAAQSRRR